MSVGVGESPERGDVQERQEIVTTAVVERRTVIVDQSVVSEQIQHMQAISFVKQRRRKKKKRKVATEVIEERMLEESKKVEENKLAALEEPPKKSEPLRNSSQTRQSTVLQSLQNPLQEALRPAEPNSDIKQFYQNLKDDLNLSATQKLDEAAGAKEIAQEEEK